MAGPLLKPKGAPEGSPTPSRGAPIAIHWGGSPRWNREGPPPPRHFVFVNCFYGMKKKKDRKET